MEANNINPFEGFEELENLVLEKMSETKEEKHLSTMRHLGIKVQSVVFPPNFHEVRDEDKVIDWLFNNIHSLHTASYVLGLRYDFD